MSTRMDTIVCMDEHDDFHECVMACASGFMVEYEYETKFVWTRVCNGEHKWVFG